MAKAGFDQERTSFNLAKLKKDGQTFQIVIDPELASKYREGKDVDIREVLKSEQIFFDAKKGLRCSEEKLNTVFGTDNILSIAETIIKQGELQTTSKQRQQEQEEKRKRIIEIIHTNAIDPKTKLPHPPQRIENAMEEAKIQVDTNKPAEQQVDEIVKKLMPIIPIKFARIQLEVILPSTHAAKMYGTVTNYGKMVSEQWISDGSWKATIEIPAGLQQEFIDTINNKTHGGATIKIIK